MDGTLYRHQGNVTKFSETDAFAQIKKNNREFISKALGVSYDGADAIMVELKKKYGKNLSIALEKEYGINRHVYFNNTWDLDVKRYVSGDPKLKAFLDSLKVKKVLLSTAPEIWVNKVLKQLGITNSFDRIIDGEGDIRKPDTRAFINAAESVNTPVEKCLLVDDERDTLNEGKKLGMGTALIANEKIIDVSVDFVVPNVYELKSILG